MAKVETLTHQEYQQKKLEILEACIEPSMDETRAHFDEASRLLDELFLEVVKVPPCNCKHAREIIKPIRQVIQEGDK